MSKEVWLPGMEDTTFFRKGVEPRAQRHRVTSLSTTAVRTSYLANENLLHEMLKVDGKMLHRCVFSLLIQSLQYVGFTCQMNSNSNDDLKDPV